MACVLMIAWLRSLLIFDQFVISDNNEFGPCWLIISQSGSLYFQQTSHSFGRMAFYQSARVGRAVSALGFLNGFADKGCVGVNYWYVVLPISALSAYLLLSKPRVAKLRRASDLSTYEDALQALRDDAIASAQSRLHRPLSELELTGLTAISSCMMMEAIGNSFAFADYPSEQIELDLRHFAEQALKARNPDADRESGPTQS